MLQNVALPPTCVTPPLIKPLLSNRDKGRSYHVRGKAEPFKTVEQTILGQLKPPTGLALQHLALPWEQVAVMRGQTVGAGCCRVCGSREICNSNSRWHSPKTKTSLRGSHGETSPGLRIRKLLQKDPVE